MPRTLYTSRGTAVEIGRELGKGGEGSVFDAPALSNQVAKLYHKAPDGKKQAKLSFMASTADSQLLNYVAWPQETLHPSRGGPVIGFLMPKVSNKDPIHMVYSPAHRRQDYPKAAWDFLLYVARNVAASFETIHSHGHVIGDVNQNSFMVGRDSKVVLIDSDSFQVNARGTIHLCEVGVSHFTPPELQSLSSFDGFIRTTNHDNFGLALLIFHVLFGGRHPYSGVPLRNGVGDALETDIKHFRYAYARDNQSRGFSPPPRSIPVSMLPDAMESMFHLAFTEKGASGARPSAHQWVAALDSVRSRLKKCSSSAMHVYPDHLGTCPWCALEKQGVVYFVDLGATFTPTSSGFVLTQVWGLIQAVPPPATLNLPTPGSFTVTAKPLPAGIPGEGAVTFYRLVAVAIAVAIAFAAPGGWVLGLLVGWAGWVMAGGAGSAKRNEERAARKSFADAAEQEYDRPVARAKKEAGPEGFHARRAELAKMKDELEGLPRAEQDELNRLHATAQERQKERFLNTCFIDRANIPGVGPARKAALRSFGIETAADVSRSQVMQVRGFGESLTRAVVDWRRSCERQFQFNPAAAVSQSDRDAVRAKFAAKRIALERTLVAGPGELQQFRQRAASQLVTLTPQLEAAARKVAQAQADLGLL
ncbi:helix-hairpin-helix domain-containing protein [Piscinibacter aquaticus]|uniref:Helix-hairpin-helix domain-containing protein n=1 Tax=Piscinibacter aquaticus TaxID=392597 RepID=A0A5C6U2Z8_9BURK|nr:helix-hairpin-helix domain-containing protein [Piscinibacter aquaticus]